MVVTTVAAGREPEPAVARAVLTERSVSWQKRPVRHPIRTGGPRRRLRHGPPTSDLTTTCPRQSCPQAPAGELPASWGLRARPCEREASSVITNNAAAAAAAAASEESATRIAGR